MGRAKQLLAWGDSTVLGQTIWQAQQADVDDVLVVIGHCAEQVGLVVAQAGETAVYNPDYATGEMLSSLQTALRYLNHETDAILVMLGDQPMLEPETINAIIRPFQKGQSNLIAPVFQGKRGNPVLIGKPYFHELLALPIGEAPRTLLKRHASDLLTITVDSDTILRDLDYPEAYERWRP
jgi:molybdenum cofactor cytidylyltransferase